MTNEEHKQGEETMLKFATGEEQLFYTEPSWKYRLETGKGNIYMQILQTLLMSVVLLLQVQMLFVVKQQL
jgi:hypothetical protein